MSLQRSGSSPGPLAAAGRTWVASPDWVRTLAALGLSWALLLWLYRETWGGMVAVWARSETFAHGFLVLPVSLWLAWRQRQALARIRPRPWPAALAGLAAAGGLWLAARLAEVNVVEQLAFVLMLQLVTVALLGREAARRLAFPLAFLWFAVPMGEALIPPLMAFTARFTVALLRLTGIPVYAEGTYFSIPGSDWSVVEGCSGIRYLIASLFLGTLYAHLGYRKRWKQGLFVVLSAVVPVIANGLRAYLIVMIAYLSDLRLALGVDHFIYGWVFFGLVVFVLFWLGGRWRDPEPRVQAPARPGPGSGDGRSRGWLAGTVLLGLGLATLPPRWVAHVDRLQAAQLPARVSLVLPERIGPWRRVPPFTDWRPHHLSPTAEAAAAYAGPDGRIGVHLAYYAVQRQGAELINSQNYLVPQKHPRWHDLGARRVSGRGVPPAWIESELAAPDQRLLVWRCYWLDGRLTANPYRAKALEALDRLRGRFPPAADVLVYTAFAPGERVRARARLERFFVRYWPVIATVLRRAGEGRHG